MKFKVPQVELAKALTAADKSLPTKANLPILGNISLSLSKDKLTVLATDLETAARVVVPASGDGEGTTTVSGKVLIELVGQLSEGDLSFEKLGEEVLVSSSGNSARLATMSAEDFPAIPKIEKGKEVELDALEFIDSVRKVQASAAGDDSRPILSGILVEFTGKKMSMVATDGYRLSFTSIPLKKDIDNLAIVIPAKSLSEFAKIVSENFGDDEKQQLTMVIADGLNQVNFKIKNIEFTSRVIEGEFPNWRKIIPATFSTKVKIDRFELTKKLRIASIFARDSGNIVKLKLENNLLTAAANTSQVGSDESQTKVLEMSGKGGEIAFNYRYLLEALSVIDDDEVNFEMIESLSPGRLTGADEKGDFFHIIMPVRLQS